MRYLFLFLVWMFWPNSSIAGGYILRTWALPPISSTTLAPPEAKQFTRRAPEFAAQLAIHRSYRVLHYDEKLAALLEQVNVEGNTSISWASDQDVWGQEENWDFPCEAPDHKLYDDCDGFAIWKLRRLIQLGLPSTPLLFTLGYDEKNEYHAVLVVATDAGDFVLDNRMVHVVRTQDLIALGYIFDKRVASGDSFDGTWVQFSTSRPVPLPSPEVPQMVTQYPNKPTKRLCLPR